MTDTDDTIGQLSIPLIPRTRPLLRICNTHVDFSPHVAKTRARLLSDGIVCARCQLSLTAATTTTHEAQPAQHDMDDRSAILRASRIN